MTNSTRFLTTVLFILVSAACGRLSSLSFDNNPNSRTATPSRTASITPTFTQTVTPSPSSTPTPTAFPMVLEGNPRNAVLDDPVPKSGAPCGTVDTLDFPLDPPDGNQVNGGFDFGVFRDRYDGYHTGEDWGFGRGSFGRPVYSIGHGRITYAQPNGWGSDKGVLIIRHTFRDGTSLLSFYGHLDPPSVILRAGQCVARGEKIGEIGRPRTTPHLHFEIRTNMPEGPGPGYWPYDPVRAGWLPPSTTIWDVRNLNAPGIVWSQPSTSWFSKGIGTSDNEVYIALAEGFLLGIQILDGEVRWRQPLPSNVTNALLIPELNRIYLSTSSSRISAYRIHDLEEGGIHNGDEFTVEPIWTMRSGFVGRLELFPLPHGGVLATNRNGMVALSSSGSLLWRRDQSASIVDWLLLNDTLLLNVKDPESSIWSVEGTDIIQWDTQIEGVFSSINEQASLYDPEFGVYRLSLDENTTELVLPLSRGFSSAGNILSLPDGDLFIAHADIDDRRLIKTSISGAIEWERSLKRLPSGDFQLLAGPEQVYLLLYTQDGSTQVTEVFQLEFESGILVKLFSGGSRGSVSFPENRWASVVGGQLIFNISGSNFVALDPELAAQTILE